VQLQTGECDVTCLEHLLDKPHLRFCLRATVNAVLAFGLAHVLAVPMHGLWAVLTAVLVIQMSVGGSLKAAADYIIGTVCGAAYATAVAALVPHSTMLAFAFVLALTVAPLAYAAGVKPAFRAAPVTAVLVLMVSTQLRETPIELAFDRSLGVALGGVVAVAVSLLVFPGRAHALGLDEAGRVLEHMAQVLPAVMAGFRAERGPLENVRLQDDIGEAVHAFAAVAGEAKPERLVHLAAGPDPAVLARTLLRLRHDLVMIGRAAAAPLPDPVAARLAPVLTRIGAKAREHLLASASALTSRHAPPQAEPVDSALAAYLSELASIRADGLMDCLPASERERLFALGFMLQQLQQNLSELAGCLHEWARTPDEATHSGRRFGLTRLSLRRASMLAHWDKHLPRLGRAMPPRAHGLPQLPAVASLTRASVQTGVHRSHG
jgi:uncharacterized membrane protein YccC